MFKRLQRSALQPSSNLANTVIHVHTEAYSQGLRVRMAQPGGKERKTTTTTTCGNGKEGKKRTRVWSEGGREGRRAWQREVKKHSGRHGNITTQRETSIRKNGLI